MHIVEERATGRRDGGKKGGTGHEKGREGDSVLALRRGHDNIWNIFV